MRYRVGVLMLASAVFLMSTGCKRAPAPASLGDTHSATTERNLRLPGTYVPKETGRGSQTPPRVSASPPPRRSPTASPSPVQSPAPTPVQTPSTSPSPQDILAGLPMGRVVFACPPAMKVATSERVEVRISGNPKENLVAGLQERGVPIVQPSKIAPVMKVTLTPDEDGVFQVKSLSADEQLMSGDDYSQWVWSVTPLKSGTHNLYLTVNVVVDVPGLGAQEKEIPVLTQAVRVQADAAYSAGQFWSSNWQWFLSTLLIPFGVWLWAKRGKSKA